MRYGIAIIALGHELYGSCAFNLALSLKVWEPNLRIAILHDGRATAHLTEQEMAMFTDQIMVPEDMYVVDGKPEYQRAKVCLDLLSPYDETMYMDADNIWFDRPVSWLYGEVCHTDFHIQQNGAYNFETQKRTDARYTYWWDKPRDVCIYWGINTLPQTISGWFFFKKSSAATQIFQAARVAYDDSLAPCIPWAGGRPDEYCFNVALGKIGNKQSDRHVFYFDKLHGQQPPAEVYRRYWGLATGGAATERQWAEIYDRLVNKYSLRLGITTRRYHIDKRRVIKARRDS
jgi:hypothetical protein